VVWGDGGGWAGGGYFVVNLCVNTTLA